MKLSWGKILERFIYDFDGHEVEIIKYLPWKTENGRVMTGTPGDNIEYHCEEIHESAASLEYLLIAWIARRHLGGGQYPLVLGIAKALNLSLEPKPIKKL